MITFCISLIVIPLPFNQGPVSLKKDMAEWERAWIMTTNILDWTKGIIIQKGSRLDGKEFRLEDKGSSIREQHK